MCCVGREREKRAEETSSDSTPGDAQAQAQARKLAEGLISYRAGVGLRLLT